jgi:hypothetical protein
MGRQDGAYRAWLASTWLGLHMLHFRRSTAGSRQRGDVAQHIKAERTFSVVGIGCRHLLVSVWRHVIYVSDPYVLQLVSGTIQTICYYPEAP